MDASLERGVESSDFKTHEFKFMGDSGTLFGIFIYNLFLILVTLGVFYFWGKVRIRNYMYHQTAFEDDRFGYHGTGGELLRGWLIAAVVLGGLIGLPILLDLVSKSMWNKTIGDMMIFLFFLIFMPIGMVYSQRYRLSRTSLRGIRFSFRGRPKEFLRLYVPGLILSVLTFWIYYPYFHNNMRKYLVENSYYGNEKFEFDGEGTDIVKNFIIAIILSIFTLGIYWFWFSAWRYRYYWSHTHFKGATFRSTVQGTELFTLKLGNLLIYLFTLGLGWPWVSVRNINFVLDNLYLDGELNLDEIVQEAKDVSATGEGITDILDIDVLGMNLGI